MLQRLIRDTLLRRLPDRELAGIVVGIASGVALAAPPVPSLPVPCVAGNCGANASGFVSSGSATAVQSGSNLTVQQSTAQAALNWASFNVGKGDSVTFEQPSSSAIALNRIFDSNPSSIFGTLTANGQIYLINANGFVFGSTATVNVAGLIASSLNMTDATFSAGILAPLATSNSAALQPFTDSNGNPIPNTGAITVQQGAQLTASSQGRLLLAAPTVTNAGTLTAANGQVILAAGQSIYLQASPNDDLRGLIVQVDQGGTAWNQLTGAINTPEGNISLVGLMVNQDGRLSASTSVSANGSVILEAGQGEVNNGSLSASQGGQVELGADSSIDLLPDYSDPTTAVAAQLQLPSQVSITGQQVLMKGGTIDAPSAQLKVTAVANPSGGLSAISDPSAEIQIDPGTDIDLAGSTAVLPMSANLITVQLRSNELADDPSQRGGPLEGQTVVIDMRADGGQGTPIADVSAEIAAVGQTIAQRTETGGTASFESQGSIAFGAGASINVSGGETQYQSGVIQTTELVGADGKLYNIGTANPDIAYVGVVNPTFTQTYSQWGVQQVIPTPGMGEYQSGYVQGAQAGSVQFAAPSIALSGSLQGAAVNGPYQRTASTAVAGGTLIVGVPGGLSEAATAGTPFLEFVSPAIIVVSSPTADAQAGSALQLPAAYLTSDGFTNTQLYSDFGVSLPAGLPLVLPPSSSLLIEAPNVGIGSSITALGGALTFQSIGTPEDEGTNGSPRLGVSVADGVTLDVSGQWTNDIALEQATSTPTLLPTLQQGGSIDLQLISPTGELAIGNNVSLEANGGAWLSSSGQLTDGAGGSITLDASPSQTALEFGSNLSIAGYGVGTAAGGSFTLLAPRLAISQGKGSDWTSAQSIDDLKAPGGVLQLYAPLFSDEGFSAINLTATGGVAPGGSEDVLSVSPGTSIVARAQSLQLQPGFEMRASGGTVASFTQLMTLPEYQRTPTNVSLNVLRETDDSSPISSDVGTLDIATGASILADPDASISLTSQGSLVMDGTLRSSGGNVTLEIASPSSGSDLGFLPNQGLVLGPQALIDVGGTAILQPNTLGLQIGDVLPGGSVSLIANRGTVLTDPGSMIDISGSDAPLEVLDAEVSGGYTHEVVASAAGSLQVSSVESISLLGGLEAQAGSGSSGTAAGGSLAIELEFPPPLQQQGTAFPTAPQQIELVDSTAGWSAAGPYSNSAVLGVEQLMQSGFDSLTLDSAGSILIATSQPLALGRELTLEAPVLEVGAGFNAALAAPYVSIGTYALPPGVVTPAPANPSTLNPLPGDATLEVSAQQINLVGTFGLQGVAAATLQSAGDVQLEGNSQNGVVGEIGQLTTAGSLAINAERVYPDTFTSFTIDSLSPSGTVTIGQTGASPGTPLSAGGSVNINANDIRISGTLLAPFGSIGLTASNDLTLANGGLVSVSGAGTEIPYGETELGATQWDYVTSLGTQTITGVPTKQVTLSAPNITIQSSATVDLQGGGDLYAYEWVPGTGGTADALAVGTVPGLYAIVPTMAGQAAPYDPEESVGSNPTLTVYLTGMPGLAAGFYALLPPRYALLPGADLVQMEPSIVSAQTGVIYTLPTGAPVVAGYLSSGTTGLSLGTTEYEGFAIYPGSYGQELAAYTISTASSFFSAAAAASGATSVPLPADAGSLSLQVANAQSNSLDLEGQVLAAAASGGRGAQVSISAPDLELNATGTSSGGAEALSSTVLQGWNASELTLGGTLSADGSTIAVAADTITVDASAQLSAPQIILVAQQSIDVQGGALLASTSGVKGTALASVPADQSLTLTDSTGASAPGDALLAVSDLSLPIVQRPSSPVADGATVTLEGGATLSSRGALALDAPGGVEVAGTLNGPGASWSLGSNSIAFVGSGATSSDTLQIDSALLGSMQQAGAVRLASASSIDLVTPVALGVSNGSTSPSLGALTLIGTSVNNESDADSSFGADTLTLGGLGSSVPSAPTSGTGTLSLAASVLNIGPGALSVNGFANTQAEVSGAVIGTSNGTLAVGGNLAINAGELTAAPGSQAQISASGSLQIGAPAKLSDSTTLPTLLGGSLALSANQIEDSGAIVVPAGLVSLTATGNLDVSGTATITTAGQVVQVVDQTAAAPGGDISLVAGGNLSLDAGSRLSVAGAGNAPAGALNLTGSGTVTVAAALAGTATGANGGSFSLDAGQLNGSVTSLASALTSGGFTDQINLRVNTGDLDLPAGSALTANQVTLTADTGAVDIGGTLSAPSGNQRGNIDLYGGTGVTLEPTASLQANGTGASGLGGQIVLSSTCATCTVTLDPGSVVSATGAAQMGQLVVQAPTVGSSDVAINVGSQGLGANVSGVGQVLIDAVLPTFVESAATIGNDLSNDVSAAASYLTSASSNIAARLTTGSATPLSVQAGVQIEDPNAAETLSLPSLDLSSYSLQGQVINLTVRAAGGLAIPGTISDGFTNTLGADSETDMASATMQFVAGADLSSANPLATIASSAADLTLGAIGSPAIVRTGTGDLALVASGDVVFEPGSSVYTGGLPAVATQVYSALNGNERLMNFPVGGGNILVSAGQDVVGSPVSGDGDNYTVTAWQIRIGGPDPNAPNGVYDLGEYGVDFDAFDWNIGALGGGDVTISAGGNAINVSAAVADSLVSADNAPSGQATLYGAGGGLTLTAGNNVASAQLFVADGVGTVTAGGGLTTAQTSTTGIPVGSDFALDNSQISVWARGPVQVETAYNPTIIEQGSSAPNLWPGEGSVDKYFTYGTDSALNLESTAGSVTFEPGYSTLVTLVGSTGFGDAVGDGASEYQVLPASLSISSLQGNIVLQGPGAILYPSSTGQLTLLAAQSILGQSESNGGSELAMSDDFASNVPTAGNPNVTETPSGGTQLAGLEYFQGDIHAGDTTVATVTAGQDIDNLNLYLPKPTQVVAGQDINNLLFQGQNTATDATTLISAGQNITQSASGQIQVGGPGSLDVLAGGNINLGLSNGITTVGNLANPNLPTSAGASITVAAGLGAQGIDYTQFLQDIVAPSATYQAELVSYVESESSQTGLSFNQAETLFDGYTTSQQLPLVDAILFNELAQSGVEASTGSSLGYSRGYAAIQALFPNSTASATGPDPYSGNLNLTFSEIYSLSGGGISILTPGGSIDVGLANPPPSLSSKPASELGIVAEGAGDVDIYSQGDVNVNKSRIFTLGGGNILIWSNEGSIDAGNGSKASLSVPPPAVLVSSSGLVTLDFAGSLAAGSGIRTIQISPSVPAGNVELVAPVGTVNAGDAGIGSAGNIDIAAQHVIGVNNINFGGTATGVPALISNVGASLSGVTAVASTATNQATSAVQEANAAAAESATPLAQAALSYLDVFVTGLGEENCKPDDTACLQRQKHQ